MKVHISLIFIENPEMPFKIRNQLNTKEKHSKIVTYVSMWLN